jgi:hypothetical protein
MKRHLILLVSTLALLGSSAFAQTVPDRINYQGNVKTASGPVGAGTAVTRPITFKFYKVATGGTATDLLWTEIQQVSILDGNFSVLLGSGSGVPSGTNTGTFQAVFANTSLYIGITVDVDNVAGNDTEITPRQQLVTTAFAFRAGVAAKVDDAAVTGTMIAASAVSTAQLGANAVTAEKIATSAVTTTQILDGSIGASDLGTGSVTTAKILDGTVATADIADSAVTTAKQADSSITTAKILDATIATADMADAAVTTAKIADGAVTTAKIASGVNLSAGTLAATGNATIAGSATIGSVGGTATLKVNDKPVPVAEENLRMVRGSISQTSTTGVKILRENITTVTPVTRGTGWSLNGTTAIADSSGTGHFRKVLFNPPFSDTPTITAATHVNYSDQNQSSTHNPNFRNVTKDGFEVSMAAGYYYQTAWYFQYFGYLPIDFIAIGPR